MVESYRHSAKHQRGSFHGAESSQAFLKAAMFMFQILPTSYFLFNFNRINIFDLSVWFLTLYMNMICIRNFNCKGRKLIGQNKVKICKL